MEIFSVVGVHVVAGAKKTVILLGFTVAALVVRLRGEHGRALAFGVLALGLRHARISVRVIVEEKASLLILGAAIGEDE